MSDEKPKKIEDVVIPTLDEMGFDPTDESDGVQDRTPLRDQDKPAEKEETQKDKEQTTEYSSAETEYSDTELDAIAHGWTPKDQFKGDPKKWRPADVYLEQGQLMDKISTSNKKISRMQEAIDSMTGVIQKLSDTTVAKERNELHARRREAIIESDVDRVELYDKEIQKLDAPVQKKQDISQDVQDFVYENTDWFNEDHPDMRGFAIGVEEKLARQFPQLSDHQRLTKTKEMVVKQFPDYFGVKSKTTSYKPTKPRVESPTQQSASPKEVTFKDLPPAAKQIARSVWLASNKKIDLDLYAKNLVKSGEVEL
jgi:hypothetical protein